ncbi:MAG: endonuclease/exonuclease/phosphatase family protein [Oscillospiraceae bacterium]|nr:endonuclease/exonuclease/phosphatase family protein [Oscillospiraceae bacterium]
MITTLSFACPACKTLPVNSFAANENLYAEPTTVRNPDGSSTVRVATFNTKNCDNGRNIVEIAAEIKKQNAQIVFLQELDSGVKRSGKQNLLKQLSELLEMNYAFFPAMALEGGSYGVGILSRFYIQSTESFLLDTKQEEPRVLAKAEVSINGRNVDLYNTHLSFESETLRIAQLKLINEKTTVSTLFILGGDFNAKNFEEYSVIQNSVTVNSPKNQFITYRDAGEGSFGCIDNLLLANAFVVLNAWMAESAASDHNLLVAEIRVPAPGEDVSRETSTNSVGEAGETTGEETSGQNTTQQKGV